MKENSFSYEKLIECGKGMLFGEGNAQLPLPPMLMFDRITNIQATLGLSQLKNLNNIVKKKFSQG